MNRNLSKEELLKLLDIEFFQKIQDRLSDEFGIASVITDIDGNPLTNNSNFSSFCMNYVRQSPEGLNNCKYCDAIGGFSAKRIMRPVIYTCHTGLTDFASPIIIDGQLVGCFLCGQVLTNNLPKNHFKKIAKKLNLNSNNLDTALKTLKLMPFEKVEYFANFLFEISTRISNFSHYQNIGNKSTQALENNLNNLFSIIAEYSNKNEEKKKSFPDFLKKLKLIFSVKEPEQTLINQSIEDLNKNFFYLNSKIKDFNNKFKGFKIN